MKGSHSAYADSHIRRLPFACLALRGPKVKGSLAAWFLISMIFKVFLGGRIFFSLLGQRHVVLVIDLKCFTTSENITF